MNSSVASRHPWLLGLIPGTCGLGLGAPSVLLPAVASHFHVNENATAWLLASFLLALAITSTVGGRSVDASGPRRLFLVGVVATLLGSAMCVIAPSFGILVGGRVVQGIGAGALSMVVFGTIATFPEARRPAISGAVMTTSIPISALGPLAGALMEPLVGWRGGFALPALAVLECPVLIGHLPHKHTGERSIDLRGAALTSVAGLAFLSLLLGPATSAPAWLYAALALTTVTAGIFLAAHVAKHATGFLPAIVLRNYQLVKLILAAATLSAGYAVVLFAAPLLLQTHHDWTSIKTGIALTPAAGVAALAAHFAPKIGRRSSIAATFATFCCLSGAGLALSGLGHSQPACLVLGAMATVVGFAASQALMLDRVPALVPITDVGIALGFYNFVFTSGSALGPAAAGGIGAITGLPAALVVIAALPLAGIIATRAPRP